MNSASKLSKLSKLFFDFTAAQNCAQGVVVVPAIDLAEVRTFRWGRGGGGERKTQEGKRSSKVWLRTFFRTRFEGGGVTLASRRIPLLGLLDF